MYSRTSRRAVAGLVFALSAHHASYAQTSKGILVGVARDTTGASIAKAVVTVTNQATGEKRVATTSTDGTFRIEAISPGKYSITAASAGFTTLNAKDVPVNASVVTTYDVNLSVGGASAEVTVEAAQTSINTDNGQLAGVVGAEEMDKLPVFSLNPVELALTVPGVQPVANGTGAFSNGINIQVNGARPRDNNFLMDGQEINDVGLAGQAFQPQIPDIIGSETVITNSASAEYGRGSGGIVNLVTKAGTNAFHGSLWERYNGSGLNSTPGNYRGSEFVKTRFNEHTFGFTVGGPILKNKLFFFGAGQWQRVYGQETPGVNLLPDANGYATLQTITGTAATQVAQINQYLSNGAYLNQDLIYPGSSGPIRQNVGALPGCPATGCIITFQGFQRPTVAISEPDTQWMYRVDYHPWERDSISFRYLHDRASLSPDFGNFPTALAGFDTQQGGPTELGAGQWTHIFSPKLLNEFRVTEARLSFAFNFTPQTLANPLNALPSLTFAGLTGTTSAGSVSFPTLGPNQNFPQGRSEDLYQFQDTIRYSAGRQSISAGADIGRLIEIDLVSQNALGTLGFVRGGTGVSSLGNFLRNQLGPSGTATKTFGPTRADSHGWRNSGFAQDDIKLNADFTVNLGVRYDYLSNPENTLTYPGVNSNNVYAPINTVVPVQKDWNNVAPRIGFAYNPHNVLGFLGDGKTSIRGGFGIFYDSTFSNILVNSAQSSPNAVAATLTSTTGNGLGNASSLLGTISPVLNPLSSVTSEDSNLVNPLTYQYNLGIERQMPGDIVFGIRYVGTRGLKEFANQQYNYFDGNTGRRLNPNRGVINLRGNYADSDYNGLEVTGSHNFKHGLLINANYVYSKDLDTGSEIFTVGTSTTSYTANLSPNGGRRQDWGPSAFDHRNFFSVSYVYQIPGPHSTNHFTDVAENIFLRNWTLSGISQLQSGLYANLNAYGFDLNGDGSVANDRPIVINKSASLQSVGIDGHFVGGTTGSFYDMAAYNNDGTLTPVQASQVHFLVPYFPNNSYLSREIGRNSYLNPGTTSHEFALEKGFSFFERARVILRGEAQNVFNHNDSSPGDWSVTDAGSGGFLAPARLGTNRQVVLWGKVEF